MIGRHSNTRTITINTKQNLTLKIKNLLPLLQEQFKPPEGLWNIITTQTHIITIKQHGQQSKTYGVTFPEYNSTQIMSSIIASLKDDPEYELNIRQKR